MLHSGWIVILSQSILEFKLCKNLFKTKKLKSCSTHYDYDCDWLWLSWLWLIMMMIMLLLWLSLSSTFRVAYIILHRILFWLHDSAVNYPVTLPSPVVSTNHSSGNAWLSWAPCSSTASLKKGRLFKPPHIPQLKSCNHHWLKSYSLCIKITHVRLAFILHQMFLFIPRLPLKIQSIITMQAVVYSSVLHRTFRLEFDELSSDICQKLKKKRQRGSEKSRFSKIWEESEKSLIRHHLSCFSFGQNTRILRILAFKITKQVYTNVSDVSGFYGQWHLRPFLYQTYQFLIDCLSHTPLLLEIHVFLEHLVIHPFPVT